MARKREWEKYSRWAAPASVCGVWVNRHWPSIEATFRERIESGEVRLNRMTENGREPEMVKLLGTELKFLENKAPDAGVLTTEIVVSARLELIGLTDDEDSLVYESSETEQWFSIQAAFFLEEEDVSAEYLREEVYNTKRRAENRLDSYMIPYLSSTGMRTEGEKILRRYAPEMLMEPRAVSGYVLAKRMGLLVQEERLSHDNSILGMLFLYAGKICVYDEKREKYVEKEIGENTILIDRTAITATPGATEDGTVIHECVHYEKHAWYQWLQRRADSPADHIACPSNPYGEWPEELMPLWRMEMQARSIGLSVQLPERTVRVKVEELLRQRRRKRQKPEPRAYLLNEIISELSAFFQVPKQTMKRRLLDLDYMDAHGILNYANGRYTPVYIARPGTCTRYDTYTLDIQEALYVYRTNETLRKLLNTGRFLYIDGHFCLDSARYIARTGERAYMTLYAREHIDECCLRFETRKEVRRHCGRRDGVFHCDAFRIERRMTVSNLDARKFEEAAAQMWQEAERIATVMRGLPALFCDTLKAHMDRLGVTCEVLAERMSVSVRKIHELRSQEIPLISTRLCVAVCIALHLEPELSEDLMRKARIVLSGAKEDVLFNLMLKMMYTYGVKDCNKLLVNAGLKPLTADKDMAELTDSNKLSTNDV